MIYFICEGEEEKAEYNFMSAIASIYCSSYKLIGLNGSKCMDTKIMGIIENNNDIDSIILFFDYVVDANLIVIQKVLRKIRGECERRNIFFTYTTYYSFEEIFLSFDALAVMANMPALAMVSTSLRDLGYYDKDSVLVHSLTDKRGTREQVSKSLLSIASKRCRGKFLISGEKFGGCWLGLCTDLFQCNVCKYPCKKQNCIAKLEYIEVHSILKDGVSFGSVLSKLQ